MKHIESRIQRTCVTWFRLQYRTIANLLFAVPNGGARNAREAAIMKGEGVTSGVSDMILLFPAHGYSALCIEFKTETGKQSTAQRDWQKLVESNNCKYIICRSFDDFCEQINEYLKNENH
jgi:hypothetical protein